MNNTEVHYGPTVPISEHIHSTKYRGKGESFKESMSRVANALKDNEDHYHQFRDVLLNMRFMPGGRIQSAIGSPRKTTAYNCFVSGTINDDMNDIMDKAKEAATTMRLGGGIGYDFSTLRPKGDRIKSLESTSSGPVSFMQIYNSVCGTIRSAGHRRGAQMGVMRVDHPDIEEFVNSKTNDHNLTNFNISVAVTDDFMEAVKNGTTFDLKWDNRVYDTIDARALWDKILRATWEWAEPGILFIDHMNKKNNLWYCETIAATNPCGEQPLGPYAACLLGSFNLTKYVVLQDKYTEDIYAVPGTNMEWVFDYDQFREDVPIVVRAMDNVIDRTIYPLAKQEQEAKNKRRMGLGVTGVANAIECLGHPYGSAEFLITLETIMTTLRDEAYKASINLAKEKGPFPLYDEKLLESGFAKTLPDDIKLDISIWGLRNSHLLSIAPTGTISLCADNISSGIEPVFSYGYDRSIIEPDGTTTINRVEDYGVREFGVYGKTADKLSVFDHVNVLNVASAYVDSACSKTCNVGDDVTWEDFKSVYMKAYDGGASGCTTFRASGKRFGVLNASADEEVADEEPTVDKLLTEGSACYFDPDTGLRTCE